MSSALPQPQPGRDQHSSRSRAQQLIRDQHLATAKALRQNQDNDHRIDELVLDGCRSTRFHWQADDHEVTYDVFATHDRDLQDPFDEYPTSSAGAVILAVRLVAFDHGTPTVQQRANWDQRLWAEIWQRSVVYDDLISLLGN